MLIRLFIQPKKQSKTKRKRKKKTITIQHERHVRVQTVLACKQTGRLDMQSMYVRKSKRERERERKDCEEREKVITCEK